MGRLQEQAKPILIPYLSGEWPEIPPEKQRTLAAWVTMATMVFEFADRGTQATRTGDHEHLRLTIEPPANWCIWLGKFKGQHWRSCFNHFGWAVNAVTVSGETRPGLQAALVEVADSQTTAFVLGTLFVQTFSSYRTNIDALATGERLGLRLLWPTTGDTVLLPTRVLSDIEADGISRSFIPLPWQAQRLVRRAWEPR
jgi:hypothetical protein